MRVRLEIKEEEWPYRTPFRIARGVAESLRVVVARLTAEGGQMGRGEAAGVDYAGESVATMRAQLESVREQIEQGLTREELAEVLPAGGARNSLDCALWDLEAKLTGIRAFARAGYKRPRALTTCATIGIGSDAEVRIAAVRFGPLPRFKVKVDAERPIQPVQLVRDLYPACRLIVDANQSWSAGLLRQLSPRLAELGVDLIEQPLPRAEDEALRAYSGRIRLAADESCVDRASLPDLVGRYGVVNIKLDKTGGLTEALALAREARRLRFSVMVGCMAGTSLAMAPGMVVAQEAEFVDLDGPLLHERDRSDAIHFDNGQMSIPSPRLWG